MADKSLEKASNKSADIEFTPVGHSSPEKLNPDIIRKYYCTPTKSGQLIDNTTAIVKAMECRAYGLSLATRDAHIVGYDESGGKTTWTLIISHQALLKRACMDKEFKGFVSGIIVRDKNIIEDREGAFFIDKEELLGAWCKVFVEGRDYPPKRINLSVYDKGNKFWRKDPGGMIVKCAEAAALRMAFPFAGGGDLLIEEEYSEDTAKNITDEVDIDLVKKIKPNKKAVEKTEPEEGKGKSLDTQEDEKDFGEIPDTKLELIKYLRSLGKDHPREFDKAKKEAGIKTPNWTMCSTDRLRDLANALVGILKQPEEKVPF